MWKKMKAKRKRDGEIVRCMEEDTTFFVYGKGRKRYGYRFSKDDFYENYELLEGKSEKEEWETAYKKIIKLLSKSNLWPNILERSKKILEYGYDVWKEIVDLAHKCGAFDYIKEKYAINIYSDLNEEERNSYVAEANQEMYGELIEKYPEYFYDYPYNPHFNEWEWRIPSFKSMYFGWDNRRIKEEILSRFNERLEHRVYCDKWNRTGYDVSFSYNPKDQTAFYSEEYRGCGNGHYYLALNHSCALFCEND